MSIINSDNMFQIVVRLIVLLTAMPIHECAHALVADKLGDPTARNLGRITLNPLPHLDPFGSLLMVLTGFGWARPVPITTRNFKNIKRDMALSAVAGPLANIFLALVVMVGLKIYILVLGSGVFAIANMTTVDAVLQVLLMMISINVGLAIFNLMPIPPLDGSRLLTALLPPKLYYGIMRYERVIMGVLFVALFTGIVSFPLSFLSNAVLTGMDFITGFLGKIWI